MTRRTLLVIAVITVITLSGGCDSNTAKSPSAAGNSPTQLYPNWPPLLNDFRFHWTAAPGIDITAGPAMVVRAYLEAYNTAWFTLNPDNVFPVSTGSPPKIRTRWATSCGSLSTYAR
jgi:hypothetical protein